MDQEISNTPDYLIMVNITMPLEKRVEAGKNVLQDIKNKHNNMLIRDDLLKELENCKQVPDDIIKMSKMVRFENSTYAQMLKRGEWDVFLERAVEQNNFKALYILGAGEGVVADENTQEMRGCNKDAYESYKVPEHIVERIKNEDLASKAAEKGFTKMWNNYVKGETKVNELLEYLGKVIIHEKVPDKIKEAAGIAAEQTKIIENQKKILPFKPNHGWHPFKQKKRRDAENRLRTTIVNATNTIKIGIGK